MAAALAASQFSYLAPPCCQRHALPCHPHGEARRHNLLKWYSQHPASSMTAEIEQQVGALLQTLVPCLENCEGVQPCELAHGMYPICHLTTVSAISQTAVMCRLTCNQCTSESEAPIRLTCRPAS